jgi:lysophospholipase L1-like esterase
VKDTARHGSPLLTLAVLVFVVFAGFAGAEIAARSRWSERELVMVQDMPFLEDDPVLLWRLRPDFVSATLGHPMLTNAIGMRDGPVGPKPAGTLRILSLGESATWGHGVEAEETYTERLGGLLARPDRPVDAINAGQPAWSIWQSWLYLSTEGIAVEPDVVLLYHLQNDLLPRGTNPRDPFDVRLTDRQLSEARRPLGTVMKALGRSRLRQALWHFWLAPRLASGAAQASTPDVQRVPGADRNLALASITRLCEERGVTLVIVKPAYGRRNHADDALLGHFAYTHPTVRYVDLPAIKEAHEEPDFFQRDDAHPTPEGHRWIAAQLAAALRDVEPRP